MATKKLQILDSIIKQAENADTLDGKHAEDFALVTDVETVKSLVGDSSVSEQINSAVEQKSQVQFITWEEND